MGGAGFADEAGKRREREKIGEGEEKFRRQRGASGKRFAQRLEKTE